MVELYIQLPSSGVSPSVPGLLRGNGNTITPESITVGGVEVGYGARENAAGEQDQYWIRIYLNPNQFSSGTHSIEVAFSDAPSSGLPRVYTAINSYLKP